MTSVLHISAVLCAIMALYLVNLRSQPRFAHRLLALVFALFAAQHLLTSLAILGLGPALVWWRPTLAMLLPPALFLHLRAASQPGRRLTAGDLLHLAPPAGLLLGRLFLGDGRYLDGAIIASLLCYGAYAVLALRTRNASGRRWKIMVCGWLFMMALADLLVMIELLGREDLRHSLILIITVSGFFLFLVYFLLTSLHQSGPLSWTMTRAREDAAGNEVVRTRLEQHMADQRPWLDPDLTVARLARQLALPQRRVSETINDEFGVSVSRWINGWRIAEAQRLMRGTPDRPLVELMLDCGFQTRSNFNKAFKGVTGETPSAWRRRNRQPPSSLPQ
ncbi:helix-turn-helix domain-containing protein [Maricaulis salignorans]|uniref:helix-turn-helix domain-containing protein n=1 Tax=Maricaulis salignorans TaxID=144026 RepID=UPI003A905A72